MRPARADDEDTPRTRPDDAERSATPAEPRDAGTGTGRRRSGEPVLPTRAAEDAPERWGDPDDSNDERLRRDVPPHWA